MSNPERPDASASADYGRFGTLTGHRHGVDVVDSVRRALGEHAGGFDVETLAAAYSAEIEAGLPAGWSLVGELLFGPYPVPSDAGTVLLAAVDDADLWALAPAHERAQPR